ncbi:aldehyde dehydrogenase (NADP(+)) [Amycolatopsis sp. OK19-0408]|uniref:Aldehyde dehydrogenase (NADP(+)) n=1 Tax=Amycolatopsis iheyensis TaxID=2945988 RepID=A0A9X2SN65_9PSEU|nr:aldehyde dehydrogenase (NADP(+)) [Amycolatopsis iheyensis]MCR6486701.1 aldehyde dehydrogenase (NADP(+)) [Amycolatopsis iheyensis]
MPETPLAAVDPLLSRTHTAHRGWARTPGRARADVLTAVADALEAAAPDLVPLAQAETNLPEGRLRGELKRTAFQLRLFADLIRDGAHLDARVDHADPDWPMGAPRPDLRRSRRPIGPVLVYAASNFPFAFSVAGGDTASALAAGNAVVVKAHPGHPGLSDATAAVVQSALGDPALLHVIHGREPGIAALKDPRIKAAGFTGSITGGRALLDIATSRPDPIPFYGELGSNNPVFVTRAAAETRADEIAAGFVASFTQNAGQFCTKPGTLLVPAGSGLARSLETATLPAGEPMLNEAIASAFRKTLEERESHSAVEVLARGSGSPAPTLLRTHIKQLLADPAPLEEECFGPTALVVEYDDEAQLVEAARTFAGQLTATLQAEESCEVAELADELAERAGRVLFNQWPTGVSVTYAQQHGGPYPATTAPGSTSVGTAAIERFLRPVAYQNFPRHLLPAELRDETR